MLGMNLGRDNIVFTLDTPSRTDHSFPPSIQIPPASEAEASQASLISCWVLSKDHFASYNSARAVNSSSIRNDGLLKSESRKRQTAQSSTLEVGYFKIQAQTAKLTNCRAAYEHVVRGPTMCTTSLLESTSQIWNACRNYTQLRENVEVSNKAGDDDESQVPYPICC